MKLSDNDKEIDEVFKKLQDDGAKNKKLEKLNDELKNNFIMTFDNNIVNFNDSLNSWDL